MVKIRDYQHLKTSISQIDSQSYLVGRVLKIDYLQAMLKKNKIRSHAMT